MKFFKFAAFALLVPTMAFANVKSDALKAISKKDKVRILAEKFNETWGDNNITTGTSQVSAATLKEDAPSSARAWKNLGSKLYADTFEYYQGESLPEDAKLEVTVAAVDKEQVEAAVSALAEGNAYSLKNSDGRNAFRRQTWLLVRTLGELEQLQAVTVKASLLDESSQEKRNVRLNAFINKENGKAVLIFTIEGTI